MKRLLVAGFGLLALVGAASAADLPPRYPVMQPRAPIYNPVYTWTGFYVGINGGGGWGRSTWDGIDKFNVSGGMIGRHRRLQLSVQPDRVRHRGRPRLVRRQGQHDDRHLPAAVARPATTGCRPSAAASASRSTASCRTSPPASRSATSRRRPPVRIARRHRHQYRLDRRRGLRGRAGRRGHRQGRVPLRRSRRLQLRLQLRLGRQRQRVVLRQHRARGHQLPLLIPGGRVRTEAPDRKVRGFFFAGALSARFTPAADWWRRRPAPWRQKLSSQATSRG